MNKLSSLSYGMLLGVTVVLSGCGGGGGGSSGSKPASSQVASISSAVSSSVASSSLPATTKLEIHGMAVADALAGGEVAFTIGAHTYKAPVNDLGQYQISLNIADVDKAQPFTAIATGVASNDRVQMAALYPSITHLRELAGTDATLDATEYLGVNISAMTTAEYALVLGRKLPITTDTERKYALLQINAVEELRRAVFVEKALTDINVYLPKKYKTTLEMLLDYEYTRGQINILHAQNFDFNGEILNLRSDSLQTYISNRPIAGKFLVTGENFIYLLDLKENGTGDLLTSNNPGGSIRAQDFKSRKATFTWVRKLNDIKVTFDSPIDYGRSLEYSNLHKQDCVSQPESPDLPDCTVKVDSMLISLFSENEVGKIAGITLSASLINSNEINVFNIVIENHNAKLFDTAQFYKFTKEDLYGYEWYSPSSSYVFYATGRATQENQINKEQFTINWVLEDGVVKLDGEGSFLLPLYPIGPGFIAMELLNQSNNPQVNNVFQKNMLLKRQSINMAASDWVGRWNRVDNHSFYSAIDYYSNHVYRDGFETQALGSWSVISNSHVRGFSNGSWRMEHELLAIHDGQHYMQYCYGIGSEDFKPINCLLEAYVIDKTFTGTTFWENWSRPLFQEADTLRQWRFGLSHDLQRQLPNGNWPTFTYEKVAANLLFISDTGKVLEMLSSDKDSISVCEYDAFSECDKGSVYNLKRSLEVKITAAGNGTVEGFMNSTQSYMFPRLENYRLFLNPSAGHTITANNIVSDCNGALVDNYYDISARDSDCKISVTFTPIL
jgi:hypothetical protein